jgi:hypothetical protein
MAPPRCPERSDEDNDVLVSGDITKGAVWFEELNAFLDEASAALVCLTRDALRSRWVHYEVGAVAKALSDRRGKSEDARRPGPIFTLLLGVKAGAGWTACIVPVHVGR